MRATLVLLLIACASRAPKALDERAIPVCPQQPAATSSAVCRCALPPIPEMPVAVGYPSADTIFVTTSDFEELTKALKRMRAWMRAAAACLGAPVDQ